MLSVRGRYAPPRREEARQQRDAFSDERAEGSALLLYASVDSSRRPRRDLADARVTYARATR